jgi:hypothetical protein
MPGWYWYLPNESCKNRKPQIFELILYNNILSVEDDYGERPPVAIAEISKGHWAGPIQEPLPNDACNMAHIHVKLKDGEYET